MPVAATSGFLDELRFQLHWPYTIDLTIDVMIAVDDADVFDPRAHFHDKVRPPDSKILDHRHGIAIGEAHCRLALIGPALWDEMPHTSAAMSAPALQQAMNELFWEHYPTEHRPMSNHSLPLVCACAMLLISVTVYGEEQTLLSIGGDRIGVTTAPDPIALPGQFLDAYYALLPDDVRGELQALRQQLRRLIPDYNVAFTAADSAELTDVKDAMDTLMASVHALHANYFTAGVAVELNRAFDAVITLVGTDC